MDMHRMASIFKLYADRDNVMATEKLGVVLSGMGFKQTTYDEMTIYDVLQILQI